MLCISLLSRIFRSPVLAKYLSWAVLSSPEQSSLTPVLTVFFHKNMSLSKISFHVFSSFLTIQKLYLCLFTIFSHKYLSVTDQVTNAPKNKNEKEDQCSRRSPCCSPSRRLLHSLILFLFYVRLFVAQKGDGRVPSRGSFVPFPQARPCEMHTCLCFRSGLCM